jgi:hypothetical protein
VIVEDAAVFEQCTDTIVRQVDDIKRMVDEFSRFARMPKAVIADEDVADTVRQVVFLMRVGHPDIDFEVELPAEVMPARIDRRLISQALTNIVKNATEAIGAVPPAELGAARPHRRQRTRDGKDVVIDVIDNGIGLPKENRARLLEPYVTTREKGTGSASPSSAAFSKSMAAASSCATRRRRFPAPAAPGCSCALPRRPLAAPPPPRRQGSNGRSDHGIRYPDRRRRSGHPRTGRGHPAGRRPRHPHRARQR